MKRLFAACLPFLLANAAWGQNAIRQNGSVTVGDIAVFRQNEGAGSGQKFLQDTGKGVNPFTILDNGGSGLCTNNAVTTGTYHSLCIGHDVNGAPIFTVDDAPHPFLGLGNGNVVGPASSTVNEIASYNSTTGVLLRQGASGITDNKSSAIAADGAAITTLSKSGITAQTIYENTIGPGGNPAPSYDAVRGVAEQPAGSTALDVNGVAGYVVNRNAHLGPAQVSGGLKGIAIAAADNSSVWGMFTIVSDKEGQAISSGVGRSLYNEVDYIVNSPGTTIGFLIGALFLSQPVSAAGPTVLKPTGLGVWNYAFGTSDGCCTVAYRIGATAVSGANVNSQPLDFQYHDAGGVGQHTTISQTPGGMLLATSGTPGSGSFVIPGGAVYNVGDLGGYQLNSRAVLAGSGTSLSIASDAGWGAITFGNTVSALTLTGVPKLPQVTTGTPAASLCIDASNNIVKKTTSGACI